MVVLLLAPVMENGKQTTYIHGQQSVFQQLTAADRVVERVKTVVSKKFHNLLPRVRAKKIPSSADSNPSFDGDFRAKVKPHQQVFLTRLALEVGQPSELFAFSIPLKIPISLAVGWFLPFTGM